MHYEVVAGWGELPEGWRFVEVAGVATDSRDRVFVFNRGDHPVMIFDRDGRSKARGARISLPVLTGSRSAPMTLSTAPTISTTP